VIIGFMAGDQHTNWRGLYTANCLRLWRTMPWELRSPVGEFGLVTLNLGIVFVWSAQRDQWIEIRTAFTQVGTSVCFAQCFVNADGKAVARANATFAVR